MCRRCAHLNELQYTDELRELMTTSGRDRANRISYSYSLPRTFEDLMKRRRNSEIWMQESFGQLGRTPDFCSSIVCGWYDVRKHLDTLYPRLAGNAERFWRFASEHDVAMTHAIGDPQVDRTSTTQGRDRTDNAGSAVRLFNGEPEDDERRRSRRQRDARRHRAAGREAARDAGLPWRTSASCTCRPPSPTAANTSSCSVSIPMNTPASSPSSRAHVDIPQGAWGTLRRPGLKSRTP